MEDKSLLRSGDITCEEPAMGLEIHKPFRLFDLPPELWVHICKLTVVDEDPIPLDGLDPDSRRQQPSITRVCRKIRAECLVHFYTSNVFFAHVLGKPDWAGWKRWFSHPTRYEHLRRFEKVYLIFEDNRYLHSMDRYAQDHLSGMNGMNFGEVGGDDRTNLEELRVKEKVASRHVVRVVLIKHAKASSS